jgi:hypothetical protein
MSVCILNNGCQEDPLIVSAYFWSLGRLVELGFSVHLYELWQLCKDPDHDYFSPIIVPELRKRGFLDPSGKLVPSLRNIVLSSIREEPDGSISLVNPIRKVLTTEVFEHDYCEMFKSE